MTPLPPLEAGRLDFGKIRPRRRQRNRDWVSCRRNPMSDLLGDMRLPAPTPAPEEPCQSPSQSIGGACRVRSSILSPYFLAPLRVAPRHRSSSRDPYEVIC